MSLRNEQTKTSDWLWWDFDLFSISRVYCIVAWHGNNFLARDTSKKQQGAVTTFTTFTTVTTVITVKRVTPVTKVTTGTTVTTHNNHNNHKSHNRHNSNNSHNSIRRALWANFSSVVTGLDYSGKTDGILVSRRQLNFTLTGSEKTSGSALEDKHKWRVKLEWLMIMYIPSIEKNLKSWPCRNGKFHYFFLF